MCLGGLGLGLGQCPCIVAGPVIGISANLNAPSQSAWGLLRSPDGETPTLYGSTLDLSDFSVSKLLVASLHYTCTYKPRIPPHEDIYSCRECRVFLERTRRCGLKCLVVRTSVTRRTRADVVSAKLWCLLPIKHTCRIFLSFILRMNVGGTPFPRLNVVDLKLHILTCQNQPAWHTTDLLAKSSSSTGNLCYSLVWQ